jgi:hypothetical protein
MLTLLRNYFRHKELYSYELRVEYRKAGKYKSDYCIVTDVIAESASDVITKSLLDYNEPKDDETIIFYITKL